MDVRLEVVSSCDLCGKDRFEVIDQPGHIMRCRNCGFKFTSRRGGLAAEIRRSDVQYADKMSQAFDLEAESRVFVRRVAAVRSFLKQGRVLDVGAGTGLFLHMLQQQGSFQVLGTEVSGHCVSLAKDRFGIRIDKGVLESMPYETESFDAVTMWHVLEHVPSPDAVIKVISRILKDKALLFIAVPNEAMFGRPHFFRNALKKTLGRIGFQGRQKKMYPVFGEKGNKHLSHFTPATLKLLLRKNGFRVRRLGVDDVMDHAEMAFTGRKTRYLLALLINRLTGLVLFDAMLVVAQKTGR